MTANAAMSAPSSDQTKLTYTSPPALAARYELREALVDRLAGIDNLTDAVVAQPSDPTGWRRRGSCR
jgi:hypothetical protein